MNIFVFAPSLTRPIWYKSSIILLYKLFFSFEEELYIFDRSLPPSVTPSGKYLPWLWMDLSISAKSTWIFMKSETQLAVTHLGWSQFELTWGDPNLGQLGVIPILSISGDPNLE